MKGHFHIFLVQNYTILHHLRQKNSRGRTPRPPSSTYLQYKSTMSSICFCREALSIVQKKHAIPKINLYVNNCLKVNFNYMYTSADGKEPCIITSRFLNSVLLLFFSLFLFLLVVKIFGKLDPPPPRRKFLDQRLVLNLIQKLLRFFVF